MTNAEWQELYEEMKKFESPPSTYSPEEREKRALWIQSEAPEEVFTIEAIRYLQHKFPAKMPAPQLGDDGRETMHSLSKRAAAAVKVGRDLYPGGWRASPFTYAALRRHLSPKREVTALRERISEAKFHSLAPEALRAMGIGERLLTVLGDPVETRETLLTKRWLTEGKRWAFILSGVGGAGKSVALAMALQHFCRERVPMETHTELQWRPTMGRYVLAGDLFAGQAFGAEGEDRVRRYSGYPLLCIDDLGTESLVSDVSRDLFFRVLDARYRGARTRLTLIATNLSWPELVNRYGERFARRLNKDRDEGAAFLPVNQPFTREAP